MKQSDRTRRIFVAIVGTVLVIILALKFWSPEPPLPVEPTTETEKPSQSSEENISTNQSDNSNGPVTISMWTNDTKAGWVHSATQLFNEGDFETESGRSILVRVEQLSSGDVFPKIQSGEIQPTIWSPGETSWINEANVVWQDLTNRPLASGPCTPVVYTAIGFGMWRPMASAMGWPDEPISWLDIAELAAAPEGWARYGHPEWGQFKFGHTHPDSSNTGFLAISSFIYAALSETEGLTPEMVKSERAREALRKLELNTYHYGVSSKSLAIKMAERGPGYLSAGTNSEIGVLATNFYQEDLMQPPWTMVFVFPEGSVMWSDNPFCILDADWVSDEQREAAEVYHEFLMSQEAQELAIDEWLRPAAASIPLIGDFNLDMGTDPRMKAGTWAVESVSGETAAAISDVFHEVKKRATVNIVLDTSQSMAGRKHSEAINAAVSFMKAYARDRDDEITVTIFNDEVIALEPSGRIGEVGEQLAGIVETIFPEGNTVLFDAVCESVEAINMREEQAAKEGDPRHYGIVLLSDGDDTNSERNESDMLECVPVTESAEGVKVFTVAYGDEANVDLLTRIANRTGAKFYEGNPDNIEEILLEILYEQ